MKKNNGQQSHPIHIIVTVELFGKKVRVLKVL